MTLPGRFPELERYATGNGQPIVLGDAIASAGEGTIRTVIGSPNAVAKIFHPNLRGIESKLAKVAAMAASRPPAPLRDGHPVVTWPSELVYEGKSLVGYLMRRIDAANAVEIHVLSNPFHRENPSARGPQWTKSARWSHLVTVAANLCAAVRAVHDAGAVVGDLQERNILVDHSCRVTLVDADSMQFTDSSGKAHFCGVARPEFIAPELVGFDLSAKLRTKNSDFFALAVHIHLLLMGGNHPFLRGTWNGAGEQPGPIELATTGDWAGGRHSRLRTHPLAPPMTFLPTVIERLFTQAFEGGADLTSPRPTAEAWHAALIDITVVNCPRAAHHIPSGTKTCPWCAVDRERSRRRATRGEVQPVPHARSAPTTTKYFTKPAVRSAGPTRSSPADAQTRAVSSTPKLKPKFKSTDYPKPAHVNPSFKPGSVDASDAIGRAVLRIFLIFAIPPAIAIVLAVIWAVVRTVQCVNGAGC